MSLKKGQKVVCVTDTFNFITKGKVYTIKEVLFNTYAIKTDLGSTACYRTSDFKPLVITKDKDYEDLFV